MSRVNKVFLEDRSIAYLDMSSKCLKEAVAHDVT